MNTNPDETIMRVLRLAGFGCVMEPLTVVRLRSASWTGFIYSNSANAEQLDNLLRRKPISASDSKSRTAVDLWVNSGSRKENLKTAKLIAGAYKKFLERKSNHAVL